MQSQHAVQLYYEHRYTEKGLLCSEVAGGSWGLPGSSLADSSGSRLPLPPDWLIRDISAEVQQTQPQHELSSVPEDGSEMQSDDVIDDDSAGLAVSCALLLHISLAVHGRVQSSSPGVMTVCMSFFLCDAALSIDATDMLNHAAKPIAAQMLRSFGMISALQGTGIPCRSHAPLISSTGLWTNLTTFPT